MKAMRGPAARQGLLSDLALVTQWLRQSVLNIDPRLSRCWGAFAHSGTYVFLDNGWMRRK